MVTDMLQFLFQSTLLQEERLLDLYVTQNRDRISIHAPTRGATINGVKVGDITTNFNPRSYKRSDQMKNVTDREMLISIHAPTRGATSTVIINNL